MSKETRGYRKLHTPIPIPAKVTPMIWRRIRQAARRQQLSPSEFVRRQLRAACHEDAPPVPPKPEPFTMSIPVQVEREVWEMCRRTAAAEHRPTANWAQWTLIKAAQTASSTNQNLRN